MRKRYFVFGLGCLLGLIFLSRGVAPAAVAKESRGSLSTADHSRFAELDKPFVSGPEVTRACLKCHNQAGAQMQRSIHWTWEAGEGAEKDLGKAHVLNNY